MIDQRTVFIGSKQICSDVTDGSIAADNIKEYWFRLIMSKAAVILQPCRYLFGVHKNGFVNELQEIQCIVDNCRILIARRISGCMIYEIRHIRQ